jgi:hypothetical protein
MQKNKILILLLFIFPFKINAQITASDSIFLNSIFTESLYNSPSSFPGTWYINDSIASVGDLYNSINSEFKFYDSEFPNCYKNITIANSMVKDNMVNPTMNYYFTNFGIAYNQIDPIYYLNFSLNSKSTKSYFTYSPKSPNTNDSVAFLLIPGSNNNQTTDVINGVGYHNINCSVKNYLKTIGDTYIYTKPGEDFRALIRKNKKLNTGDYYTPGAPSFLYNYLNSNNKPYGINYLIECIALIKYLNTKYKKVILLGCSQGGYATLLTSMNSTIDASIISSGYSINFDNSPDDIYSLQQIFGNLTTNFSDTNVKNGLKKNNAEFLFSWPDLDSYWYQLEHDSQPTQIYLTGLTNCNYYYNYSYHSFPQCANLDTFINRVLLKPKPFVKIIDSLCNSDSVICAIKFTGIPPFSFDLYKDSVFFNSYSTNTKSLNISIFQNGIYQIKNLDDAGSQPGFKSDFFTIKKNSKINFSLLNKSFDCDSLKTKISLKLNGTPPWSLNYSFNASNFNVVINDSLKKIYFPNGNLIFNSVSDSNLCFKTINTPLNLNEVAIGINFSSPQYICDSNKTAIPVLLSGKAPWTIHYKKNSIAYTIITSSPNYTVFLSNGSYLFEDISDSNNCAKTINQIFNFDYQPLNYTFTNLGYNCDSNKTKLNVTLSGNSPWTIFYRRNNIAQSISTSNTTNNFYFLNGIYEFDSIKDATCTKPTTSSIYYNFNYSPISVSAQNPIYNCDSNKAFVQFNMTGNPPYTLNFTKDGINNNMITFSNYFNQSFQNGFYYFIKVTDNTNCQTPINQLNNIQFDTLNYSIDSPKFICDSVKTKFQFHFQGNAPWTVFYRKNNSQNSFTTSNPDYSFLTTNSTFNFDSLTDATCSKIMNPTLDYIINNSFLNVIMDTPMYDCNVNKVKVHFQFQGNAPWKIHYFKIGVPNVYNSLTTYSNNYDAYFTTGNYIIDSITDNSNCTKVYNTYVNNIYSPIGSIKTATTFNCDSNKTQLHYQLFGDAPWTITYLNIDSNSIHQKYTNSSNFNFFLNNGNYVIQSLTDYKCTKLINDTLHLNVPKLISTISAEAVSCDSNKMYVIIKATSGNPPFYYKYYKNNILQIKTSYLPTDTFYLEIGAYFFERMTDSIGCEIIFNKNVVVEYNPFYFNNITNKYNCEKDSTLVSFDIANYNDVYLQYTKNNSPISSLTIDYKKQDFYFSNGKYHWINIMDSIGCIKSIDQYLEINNEPINIIKDSLIKDCENREYTYQFSFDGKSPWKVNYNKNNIFQTETFFNENNNWTIPAGKYYFINVTDSNLCSMDILRQDTLIQFLNQNPIIEYTNNRITATQIPYNYTWYKDNVIIPNEKSNVINPYGNGVYAASTLDSAGCIYYSNKITLNFPENINLYPNPSSDKVNITVNANYGDYWEYSLHDMFGNQIGHELVSFPYKEINIEHLAKGVYHFIIQFSDGFDADKKVIRFMKN